MKVQRFLAVVAVGLAFTFSATLAGDKCCAKKAKASTEQASNDKCSTKDAKACSTKKAKACATKTAESGCCASKKASTTTNSSATETQVETQVETKVADNKSGQ